MLKETKFPLKSVAEKNNWKLEIERTGVFENFEFMHAQAGDFKANMVLKCPDGKKINLDRINLKRQRENIKKIGLRLMNLYNSDIDWDMLRDLGNQAFKPFKEIEESYQ